MNELEIISAINQPKVSHESLSLGAGDDCAILLPTPHETLVTSDMLLDNTHFDMKAQSVAQIINKLFAVNCSDIYAMGGLPTLATISISLPHGFKETTQLVKAIKASSKKYNVAIMGGDTNFWSGKLAISMTLMGKPIKNPILRSGAKVGDKIIVTGPLGGSLSKGRHLSPPNNREKLITLLKHLDINSMIDISDGLASDLRHIMRMSNVGANLIRKDNLIHEEATTFEQALSDGEDFELCFTVDEKNFALINSNSLMETLELIEVGIITNSNQLTVKNGNVDSVLSITGYQHHNI
jgi:thiamine-monophosphate kinase